MAIVKSFVRYWSWKLALVAVLVIVVAGTALAANGNLGLQLSKTANPDPATVGQNLTFTITDTNNSSTNTARTFITDNLPPGLTLVRATATDPSGNNVSCSTSSTSVQCGRFTLAPGDMATVTIVVRPTQAGTIRNIATDDAGNRASTAVKVNNQRNGNHNGHHRNR